MEDYILNIIRTKKFGEDVLISTDHGSWMFMKKKDYSLLLHNKLKDKKVYMELEREGVILNDKNILKIIGDLRSRYSFLYSGPASHIVIPKTKNAEMNRETAKKIVDFIFQSTNRFIIIDFRGEEALLNLGIIKYIMKCAKRLKRLSHKELHIRIITNFNHMDKEKLDFFEKEKVMLCTSLDGPKRLHEKNRLDASINSYKNYGTYESVIKWTKEIKKRNEKNPMFKPHAVLNVTRKNIAYPKEIIDEYIKNGLKDIHLEFLNNFGYTKERWKNLSYSAVEFIDFWKSAVDYIIKLNQKGIELKERSVGIILQKIFNKFDPNYLHLRSPGSSIIGQILYDYNGDIYTCDEGRMIGEDIFKVGNVKKDTYKGVLGSKKTCSIIAASTNDTQWCDGCVCKPWCGLCAECNYAEQNNIIAKIPATNRCKIFYTQFEYIFNKLKKDPMAKKVFLSWINK